MAKKEEEKKGNKIAEQPCTKHPKVKTEHDHRPQKEQGLRKKIPNSK